MSSEALRLFVDATLTQVRIGLRNIVRQRRRSAFGILSVGFGVIALLLAAGFIEWLFWGMRESTIQSRLGHIQVAKAGYFESGSADPYRFIMSELPPSLAALEKNKDVAAVTPRLAVTGLISKGDATISFIVEGVDAAKEAVFARAVMIEAGRGLDANVRDGIIVGRGLAENLGVQPGDTVTLLAKKADGGMSGVDAQVRGTFSTVTKAYDDTAIRLPIALARQLAQTNGTHAWIVVLRETATTDRVADSIRGPLQAGGFQIKTWLELADFYRKTVTLFSRQVGVMKIIIAVIIVLSILNTLTSAVLERTGEIGTIMALGSNRMTVMRQFLIEGLLLGIVGGVLGLIGGVGLAYLISAIGIPMPPPPGMARGFVGEIRITGSLMLEALWLAAVTTLLASLYPAWKASRLTIVDALRHNR